MLRQFGISLMFKKTQSSSGQGCSNPPHSPPLGHQQPPSVSLRQCQPWSPRKPPGSATLWEIPVPTCWGFLYCILDWHPPICERSPELYQLTFRFDKTTVGFFIQFMLQDALWHQPQYRTRSQQRCFKSLPCTTCVVPIPVPPWLLLASAFRRKLCWCLLRLLKASLALNTYREEASTTSLGNPFQSLNILAVKNFFHKAFC